MLPFIYQDLWQPKQERIAAARYISVMADSSTESSTRDLESVYLRYLQNGQPVNTFVGVELQQVIAGST